MRTLLKIIGGLLGLVIFLVASLVVIAFIDLKPTYPESEFTLQANNTMSRHVLVFGATGKLGVELIKDLVERGDKVTAFVRSTSDRSKLEPLGVEFIVGDVMKPETIAAAFNSGNIDAAISAITNRGNKSLDHIGNANVADGAIAAGVKRVILISTIGAGNSYEAASFLSKIILADVFVDKTLAEEHWQKTNLDYTIIRPGGLPEGTSATGGGVVTEDYNTMGFIKRADLARLTVEILYDDNTVGKVLSVIDPGIYRPWEANESE